MRELVNPDIVIRKHPKAWIIYAKETLIDWDGYVAYVIGLVKHGWRVRKFTIIMENKTYPIWTSSGLESGGHLRIKVDFPNENTERLFYESTPIIYMHVKEKVEEKKLFDILKRIVKRLDELHDKLVHFNKSTIELSVLESLIK